MSSAKPPPVFISFRFSEALTEAQRLQQALKLLGIKSFACYAIKNGEEWTDVISNALDSCTVFVALATRTYGMRSKDNVLCTHQELRHAMQAKKSFVLAKMCTEFADPFAKVQLGGFQELHWKPGTPVPVELLQTISEKLVPSPHEVMDVWVASFTSSRAGTPSKTGPSLQQLQGAGRPMGQIPPDSNHRQLAAPELDTLDQLLPRYTKAAQVKTGAAVPRRTPRSFKELVKALASCVPGTVLDLQGLTLKGEVVTITTHDITIRSGVIALSELKVAAAGTVFQSLTVQGPVKLQGDGSGLRAHNCRFTAKSTAAVVAEDEQSTNLLLVDCEVHHSKTGIEVGNGSHVELRSCSIHDNELEGVSIRASAASLDNCSLTNNGDGISVFGSGEVALKDCEICSSHMTGVGVHLGGSLTAIRCNVNSEGTGLGISLGGSAQLEDCDISCTGTEGFGVYMQPSMDATGTSLTARGCKLHGRLYAGAGTKADLQQCEISCNKEAINEEGNDLCAADCSHVTLSSCQLQGYANYCMSVYGDERTKGELHDCDVSGAGLRASGAGSLLVARGCTLSFDVRLGVVEENGGRVDLQDRNGADISKHV